MTIPFDIKVSTGVSIKNRVYEKTLRQNGQWVVLDLRYTGGVSTPNRDTEQDWFSYAIFTPTYFLSSWDSGDYNTPSRSIGIPPSFRCTLLWFHDLYIQYGRISSNLDG